MMASGAGGGAAGEGEWLMVAQLRATVQAQDPRAKVSDLISALSALRLPEMHRFPLPARMPARLSVPS